MVWAPAPAQAERGVTGRDRCCVHSQRGRRIRTQSGLSTVGSLTLPPAACKGGRVRSCGGGGGGAFIFGLIIV